MSKKDAPKMVTFINAGGAVHTVPEELYLTNYKGSVRKLNKATTDKLGKLSAKVAELALVRASAVDKDGNPDGAARAAAAREQQAAMRADVEFREELTADE